MSSIIVIDPKGEIASITEKSRRVSDVKIINPYGLLAERPDMQSEGFNPLNDLEPEAGR
jgi:type IV secretory pathway TraG/TraD family ATPase VirD4